MHRGPNPTLARGQSRSESAIGVLSGIRVRSAGQRRHHHGRHSAIGTLFNLFWAFWSLRASAASRTCSRFQQNPL
jgi:hypothetical protein